MQTSDRFGIICDLCGITKNSEFVYYSYDFRSVSVYNNLRPSRNENLTGTVTSSIDTCEKCSGYLTGLVVSTNRAAMGSALKKHPSHIMCDMTGAILAGTYDFYLVNVTRVSVKIGETPICPKCHIPMTGTGVCSKCKGTTATRPVSMDTDRNFLEFNCSDTYYGKLLADVGRVKSTAANWSTKS